MRRQQQKKRNQNHPLFSKVIDPNAGAIALPDGTERVMLEVPPQPDR